MSHSCFVPQAAEDSSIITPRLYGHVATFLPVRMETKCVRERLTSLPPFLYAIMKVFHFLPLLHFITLIIALTLYSCFSCLSFQRKLSFTRVGSYLCFCLWSPLQLEEFLAQSRYSVNILE